MNINDINLPFTAEELQALSSIHTLDVQTKQLNQNEIFQWLIKNQVAPHQLRKLLNQQSIEMPSPLWTFHERMGQSVTQLPDGRKVYIGGEYEDYYDPDFKIYNDVVIEEPTGEIQIWQYPEAEFPPTDFHTAHYDALTHCIFIIGNMGYEAENAVTQVLKLDLTSLNIQRLDTFGTQPYWLHDHTLKVIDQDTLELSEGDILQDGKFLPNLYKWRFNLRNLAWSRPKQQMFDHWTVQAEKQESLLLFESSQLIFAEKQKSAEEFEQDKINIIQEYGKLPDYHVYPNLFLINDGAQVIEDEENFRKYTCSLQGHTFWYFKDDYLLQVVFLDSAPLIFQQQILDDLINKLKKISGQDVIAKKVNF